ncbi:MAG: NAD(P)-dependent alcohol dehydrogenase, partial [Actinobacteria bacterium]|nr:NAD(P)-dependent alcohol dehydrogenase [Actinomycetota bacterium]
QKKFDLILNTVSADLDLDPYLQLLDTDGTLVVIGLPGKPYAVNAGTLLNGRRGIAGSMIGGMPELQEMMDFCGKHQIVSDVEVVSADYINQAYERTVASDVKYRFVIDASTF